MKRNILSIYLVLTAVLFMIIIPLAGCTSTGGSTGTEVEMTTAGETVQATNPADSNQVQVICKNNRFNPESLTVKIGTTVTWTNQDGYIHTVTSGTSPSERSGLFDSGDLNSGKTFSFTFNEAGTYDYFCIPHFSLGMIGKIIVTK